VTAVRWVFAFGGLLPWLRALGNHALPLPVKLAIDQAFSALCHHLPARTLVLGGEPMCVCSRCAGVYLGLALVALWPWRRAALKASALKTSLQVGLALMAIDILTQDLGLHPPWHVVRLVTGAWVGGALLAWLLAEISPQRFTATFSRAKTSALAKATVARLA
jgi:uncharacterized membrane protein